MKIYVEMDELQFEKYKESLKKPKQLTDYSSTELAAALLNVIQKEGGVADTTQIYDSARKLFKNTSVAKLTVKNFVISLIVEKYSDR